MNIQLMLILFFVFTCRLSRLWEGPGILNTSYAHTAKRKLDHATSLNEMVSLTVKKTITIYSPLAVSTVMGLYWM